MLPLLPCAAPPEAAVLLVNEQLVAFKLPPVTTIPPLLVKAQLEAVTFPRLADTALPALLVNVRLLKTMDAL